MISLLAGFVLGALIYSIYQFRAGGIISIPLLAIYTIKFPIILPFMLLASLLTYLLLELLFVKFIIYGRRLLYIALSLGMVFVMIILNSINIDAGWYSLLIPGLIAYNAHREVNSGKNLLLSFSLNIICFILIILISFVTIYFI